MPLRESMVVDEGGRLGTSEDEASKGNAGSLASPFQRKKENSKLVLLEILQNRERREEEKKEGGSESIIKAYCVETWFERSEGDRGG